MHIDHDLRRHAVPVALPAAFATSDRGISDVAGKTSLYQALFKRVVDIVVVLALLPLVVPIIAVMIILTAKEGGNPFYCQKRVGQNGRIFTMWKMRTMIPNADAALARHLTSDPAARAEWALHQKLRNDPRITRLGQVLRKTSLDELPQIWNVLMGHMSLVGPRPMLPEQQGLYPGTAYYAMVPGITGLWQISARNESAFAERAFFDTRYFRKMSFVTDVKTLFATVGVVWRSTGI